MDGSGLPLERSAGCLSVGPIDGRLGAFAGMALGRPVLSANITTRAPIVYDPFLPGRAVDRLTGTAVVAAGEVTTWTAIVKRTTGAGLRAASRELAAYRHGVAAHRSDDALGAPALLGFDQGPGHVELWLEELNDEHAGRWPSSRYSLAAAHIARWDVAMSKARVVGVDVDDAWAQRHGQPHRVAEAVGKLTVLRRDPAADEVMALLDDDGFQRTQAMITSTDARIASLAKFPQSLLHHDLVRANLFAVEGARTAAIDWENIGPGPVGVDLAPLVVGSVRRGEASSADLVDLERGVLLSYEEALAAAGGDDSQVRTAYQLALGLRWHVVLGTVQAWLDPAIARIRGSRPDESRTQGVNHLIALSKHLLDTHR